MKPLHIALAGLGGAALVGVALSGDDTIPSKPPGPPASSGEEQAIDDAIEAGGNLDDMTNAAYYAAYPGCPRKLDPANPQHADCIESWSRIYARVKSLTGKGGAWQDKIREITAPLIAESGWYGLDDFFIWVARGESGGDYDACNTTEHGTCAPNSARGLLQLRPNSAFAFELEHLRDQPDLLFNPNINLGLGAWYAYRGRKYAKPGQTIDHWAMRRYWARPSLLADVDWDEPRSEDVFERGEINLRRVGLSDEWAYERMFPAGFEWPGLNRVLQLTGASAIA